MTTQELAAALIKAFGPNTTVFETCEPPQIAEELRDGDGPLAWVEEELAFERGDWLNMLEASKATGRAYYMANAALEWDTLIRQRLAALGYTLAPWAESIGGRYATPN